MPVYERFWTAKNLQAWNLRDGSDGCVRNTTLGCESDKFLPLNNMKLPETTTTAYVDKTMNLNECEEMCLKNCSCTAYANYQINNGGSGCLTWTGELLEVRVYTEGGTQDLYVRLATSEIGTLKFLFLPRVLFFAAPLREVTVDFQPFSLYLGNKTIFYFPIKNISEDFLTFSYIN
jgi:hypothetical protein